MITGWEKSYWWRAILGSNYTSRYNPKMCDANVERLIWENSWRVDKADFGGNFEQLSIVSLSTALNT